VAPTISLITWSDWQVVCCGPDRSADRKKGSVPVFPWIIAKAIEEGLGGDMRALLALLERLVPTQSAVMDDLEERLAELERLIDAQRNRLALLKREVAALVEPEAPEAVSWTEYASGLVLDPWQGELMRSDAERLLRSGSSRAAFLASTWSEFANGFWRLVHE
jgi:uncharacterized coiled-coil protein SlyX